MTFRAVSLAAVLIVTLAACGDSTGPGEDPCMTESLPLIGEADGPVVTDVGLELQTDGVVVFATATDPQGTDNLLDVVQTIGVYPDLECGGAAITVQDDLAGSGVEETFGTAIDASDDPALYAAIEAESAWPVTVSFADADGHRTEGRVMARIIR